MKLNWKVLAGAAVIAALLFLPIPVPGAALRWTALVNTLENAMHPLLFAGLTLVVLNVFRASPGRRILFALAAIVLFALATEIVQGMLGRDATWEDVGNDLLGIAFAALLIVRQRANSKAVRAGCGAGAAIALLLAAVPLAWTLAAYGARFASIPVLWKADALLLQRFAYFKFDRYPGLVVDEPLRDWRGYLELQVDVDNPHPASVHVILRVHDWAHHQAYRDRYNEEFRLPANQSTTLRIPLSRIEAAPARRRMDMSDIGGVILFQVAERGEPAPRVREIRLAR